MMHEQVTSRNGKNTNNEKFTRAFPKELLKVECLLTLAIWSYGHEAEEYIFLNLLFPSTPKGNSSIRCILSRYP